MDQETWSLDQASPVTAKAGDILVFSYLLVHGSYVNISDRERRMFLIQVAAGEDTPLTVKHRSSKKIFLIVYAIVSRSPCAGMVLRGTNCHHPADLDKRHED